MSRPAESASRESQQTAEAVAQVFAEAMDPLTGRARVLALAIYRLLAQGRPVAPAALASAAELELADVEAWLDEVPGVFRDEEGAIVGFWGLALGEMPHRFEVESVRLFAWCAWDTLFMPALIGKTASVSSACRATGAEITLEVGPSGVVEMYPPGAVVSMLVPDDGFDADVIQSFCHHVHFFASQEAGEQWLEGRQGDDAFLLSVTEAFRLGQLWNQHRFGSLEVAA